MNYYNKIKETFIENEIYKKTKDYFKERNDLRTYYNVGKLLIEAQGGEKRAKYGNQLIKEYSIKLTKELGRGYSERNLKYMRKFYLFQKGQQAAALSGKTYIEPNNLSWSHYQVLLSLKDIGEINYYINQCNTLMLGRNALREKIKNKEYQRISNDSKKKLVDNERLEFIDTVKDPIIIKVKEIPEFLKEKALKEYILNDIDNFLNELGEEITYVGNEYKIEYEKHNYFIDILLFSIKYNCYIVVELKIGDLKKENIIQTEFYTDLVDQKVRKIHHNKTIGIIISRKNDEYIIKFSTNSIISTTYKLVNS